LKGGSVKENGVDIVVIANYPHVHAARTPPGMPTQLVRFWRNSGLPLSFHQAVILVGEAADTVRLSPDRTREFFTRTPDLLNSAFQPALHRPFPCHLFSPVVRSPRP